MANKMTRIQALEIAINAVENAEAKEVLERIKASVEKHNTTSSTRKSETARQKENKELATKLETFLMEHAGEKFSVAQLKSEVTEIADMTPQRVTPILNKLEGVNKAKENKVNVYWV